MSLIFFLGNNSSFLIPLIVLRIKATHTPIIANVSRKYNMNTAETNKT